MVDIENKTFTMRDRHYDFLFMPFGLTNALAIFLRMMNGILRPFLEKFVVVFFDDILVFNKSKEHH